MRFIKESCLGLLILGMSCSLALLPAQSQTSVSEGTVNGTWTAAGSPYIIQGNITIPANKGLKIEKGVSVQFSGYYTLTVRGNMIVTGTKKEPVFFTFEKDSTVTTTLQTVDGWRGIRIIGQDSVKDTTVLNHCLIEKVKVLSGTNEECLGGAVRLDSGCYVVIKNSTITNNQAHVGTALYSRNSRCDINHIKVTNNHASSDGGAFCFINSNCTLNNSVVTNNNSGGNGGAVFSYGGSLTLINTVLSDNTARFGGAMATDKTSVSVINNTMTGNTAQVQGAAIHSMRSQPRIVNTILYNNKSRENEQMYLFMNAGYDIQNTSIQGGLKGVDGMLYDDSLLVSVDILNYDPMFEGGDSARYIPGKESQCIDAGIFDTLYHVPVSDIRGYTRENNGRVDLGAYEYVENMDEEDTFEQLANDDDNGLGDADDRYIIIYPNPSSGNFTIEFLNAQKSPLKLVINNAAGQQVYEKALEGIVSSGSFEITTGLTDGIYSLQVFGVGNELLETWKLIIAQ